MSPAFERGQTGVDRYLEYDSVDGAYPNLDVVLRSRRAIDLESRRKCAAATILRIERSIRNRRVRMIDAQHPKVGPLELGRARFARRD